MHDALMEGVAEYGLITLLLAVFVAIRRGKVNYLFLGLAVLIFVVHDMALYRFFGLVPQLPMFSESSWNWTGKILAIVATLCFILILPKTNVSNVGVTSKFANGARLGWIATLAFCAAAVIERVLFSHHPVPSSWDALAFQLTMPGLDEELFYRGAMIFLVDQAFGVSRKVLGAPMGIGAVVATLMFAAGHSISFSDGVYNVDFSRWTILVTGFILAWLLARTGNLMAPVLYHNFTNWILFVI